MSTNLLVWIILAPLLGAILNGGLYFYNIKNKNIRKLFCNNWNINSFNLFLITLSLFFKND